MKKLLIACIVILGFNQLNAQEVIQQQPERQVGYHQHDGFYLSMSGGPVFGKVTDDVSSFNGTSAYAVDFIGTGGAFDFKIGGAIRENLILHATIISNAISAPKIETTRSNSFTSVKAPDTFSIGEVMLYGVGMTYYVMPSNILVSGSLGIGKYTLTDTKDDSQNLSTDGGFSLQLKLGKEWWVSKNWGLGVSLTYGSTNVTNEPQNGEKENLSSNRFGILFNTTFN